MTNASGLPMAAAPGMALTADQIDLIKRTIAKATTDDELRLFLYQCQRLGLDPLAKQAHAVKRFEAVTGRAVMTIQISIDGFRLIAQRSGQYAGQLGPYWCSDDGKWVDVWTKTAPPAAARVGVMRHDFSEPLYAVARFDSYVQRNKDGQPNAMWRRMADLMLGKCAEALALRRAFPLELSGIHVPEEIPDDDTPPDAAMDPTDAPPPAAGRRRRGRADAAPAAPPPDLPPGCYVQTVTHDDAGGVWDIVLSTGETLSTPSKVFAARAQSAKQYQQPVIATMADDVLQNFVIAGPAADDALPL